MLALRTDPTIARGDETLVAAIATERRRLMDFYQTGLDAYAGERERWAENMGKVLNEDGSNPYYRWFLASASERTTAGGRSPLTSTEPGKRENANGPAR